MTLCEVVSSGRLAEFGGAIRVIYTPWFTPRVRSNCVHEVDQDKRYTAAALPNGLDLSINEIDDTLDDLNYSLERG